MNPTTHTQLGNNVWHFWDLEDGNLATDLQGLPWGTCSLLVAYAHQLQNIAPLDQFMTGTMLVNGSSRLLMEPFGWELCGDKRAP